MNETRFKNCVMPLHKTLYTYALTILKDEGDAQDCIQEAFTRLWENRNRLENVDNVSAYATVTVRNIAITMASRAKATFSSLNDGPPEIPDTGASPANFTENRDNVRQIARLLRDLPDNQRKVITLSTMAGMSTSEIKEATGLSEDNVRVLLSRGRKKLRELFSKT